MFFSVVIPSYNREEVVLRAINSVLKQTLQDFEIVVVDDGSKDKTKQVVESIKDSRLKYVWQDNHGATAARNTGVQNAKGEYVSFLDSDDEWFDTMLEKQYLQYKSDVTVGCVYSNVQVVNSDGQIVPFSKPLGACDNSYKEILKQGYMAPTTVLSAKREILSKVGLFDTELPASQDDDICFKLAKSCKVAFIPEVLANMYVGQSNRISVNSNKVANGWWMLWNKYEDDVVSLCGSQVMAKHYLECLIHFSVAGNYEMIKKTREKVNEYGGHVSSLLKIVIKIGLALPLFRNIKGGRLMRKLLKWIVD